MANKTPFGDGLSFDKAVEQELDGLPRLSGEARARARAGAESALAPDKVKPTHKKPSTVDLGEGEAPPANPADIGPQQRPYIKGELGLALSGGGIRSATFSLGVLQALATRGKLKDFDFLSTVSGGGYIGSWLSAWICRRRKVVRADMPALTEDGVAIQALRDVETALARSSYHQVVEPYQVQWLRRYSNYLTPRVGMLSADALTVVAIWMRNVFLNALILVSLTASILLLPVLALRGTAALLDDRSFLPGLIGIAGLALSMGLVATHLTLQSVGARKNYSTWLGQGSVLLGVIGVAFLAAVFGSLWLMSNDFAQPPLIGASFADRLDAFLAAMPFAPKDLRLWSDAKLRYALADTVVVMAIVAVVSLLFAIGSYFLLERTAQTQVKRQALVDLLNYFWSMILSFAVAACVLAYFVSHWNFHENEELRALPLNARMIAPLLTLGPPLMMFVFGIVGSIWVGLVGRSYQEWSREWWARMNGFHILVGVVWLVVFGLAYYVPPALAYAGEYGSDWVKAVAGTTWLGSLLAAFMAKNAKLESGTKVANWKSAALTVATIIVAVGIFVALAGLVGYVLGRIDGFDLAGTNLGEFVEDYLDRLERLTDDHFIGLTAALLGMGIVAVVLAWRVDINKFSLHNMYQNRLTRCYLGATNAARMPQPFTGFDPADDIPLKDLRSQRPFHIINTALNLVQGSELAWQQRKAASFTLNPTLCGFDLSGQQGDQGLGNQGRWRAYKPTEHYASEDPSGENTHGFSLGMAMATSGAAASPNMGFGTTPALAVIMTFFNIRLGRWSPNPMHGKWKRASPAFGLAYLLGELMGITNERSKFVYLSDGGHFENTAAYELVKRKCALIVVVDAGADPKRKFDDLANLQRKVRVDLGYEIDLSLDRLRADAATGLCGSGFEAGTVRYPGGKYGRIIVIKPSMCADRNEPVDLQNYHVANPDFPQQTTADQWFNESQFESYRKLGFEVAMACLDKHEAKIAAAMA